MGVFEDDQPSHQPRGQRRLTGAIRIGRSKRLLQERPIRLTRQLHQRMAQIDDLVQPRPEQVPLACLTTLPRLHDTPASNHLPMQGITNPICKESPFNVAVFGKIDYFQATVSDSKSTAWKFFTDDIVAIKGSYAAAWLSSGMGDHQL